MVMGALGGGLVNGVGSAFGGGFNGVCGGGNTRYGSAYPGSC